jgi:FkbM family methyltransferase
VLEREIREGDVFLDVGANCGYFTLLASRLVGPSGRVLGFEPNPQVLQLLGASVIENGAANVTLYPFAASDSEGILKLIAVDSNAGVTEGRGWNFLAPAARIDDLLCGRKVDVLKIDVEGHEPAALRGMEETIRRHLPTIVTEFNPRGLRMAGRDPEDYLRQLASYGYRVGIIPYEGEVLDADPIEYWRALRDDQAHLDLLARPR